MFVPLKKKQGYNLLSEPQEYADVNIECENPLVEISQIIIWGWFLVGFESSWTRYKSELSQWRDV